MADFTFTPIYAYKGSIKTEKLVVNELEDHSEIRFESGETIGGTYSERYKMSGQEFAQLMAFFVSKRMSTPFTKLTYDPSDPSFDPDDPADSAGPEETVRFASDPKWTNPSLDVYQVTLTFKRLPNE